MLRFLPLFALVIGGASVSVPSVQAASFDCAKASTPFEHAICDSDDLSAADERLARSYAAATGGLSTKAADRLKVNQREWLDYAQRACTRDAEPLTSGSYDERGVSCLSTLFGSRSDALETSRMISGIRFYPIGSFAALPDPNEKDNPDSYYPVATHETTYVQIDGEGAVATAFNAAVEEEVKTLVGDGAEPSTSEDGVGDDSSDTANTIKAAEVAGTGRITLSEDTYWYGHGAAHGNYTTSYLHYLTADGRWMEASDLFKGKGWQKKLTDLAIAALKSQHSADMLMIDDPQYVTDAVIDPSRWDLSDAYDLIIQFQPYEVAAYAYGAPTARVRWDDLADYLVENADAVRYGY